MMVFCPYERLYRADQTLVSAIWKNSGSWAVFSEVDTNFVRRNMWQGAPMYSCI